MKNLIHFSFLLILLPQISFFNWQNRCLFTVAHSLQPGNSILAGLGRNWHNNFRSKAIAQNQFQSQEILGTLTNIKSNADKMISCRHQRHMWVTSDGVIHVLLNQGTNAYGASLVLYSSFDGGRSWKWILSIPNTNSESTADGFVFKQKLFLTYSSANGGILFLPITYDSLAKKWIFSQASTVYQGKDYIATNPTIAFDSNGYLWATFIAKQSSSGNYAIKLFNSSNQGLNWNNTYLSFGAVNKSAKKSARLVALKDRLSVVFTNEDTFYWAYRFNNSALDLPWKAQSIFRYQPSSNNSIYSSHFSLVADPLDNIHLTTHDLDKLVYIKFDRQSQNWQPAKLLSNAGGVSYVQTSLSTDNRLLVAYNKQTQIGVFESFDYGKSFKFTKLLSHPQKSDIASNFVSFEEPRIIMPAIINNSLSLLQQFQLGEGYSLVDFNLKLNVQSSQVASN
jgi:hypothetical protein